jgi:hypothetical protein
VSIVREAAPRILESHGPAIDASRRTKFSPGLARKLDWNGKVLGWIGKVGRDTDANEIGESNYLSATPDEQTIYIPGSINANILKLSHN